MLKGPPVKGAHHWNKNTLDILRQIKITALRAQLLAGASRARPGLVKPMFTGPSPLAESLFYRLNKPA
jgi:hypothetical protein